MAFSKITGNQAILGGATILSAPTIYAAAYGLTTASTGVFNIYGVPVIENTTTNATLGGIKKGGLSEYVLQVPFTGAQVVGSTNYNTTYQIPAEAVVRDVFVDITTIASSLALTVGTTGDPNGFFSSVATTPVGPKVGVLTAGAVTFGDLLVDQLNTTIPSKARVDYSVGASAVNVAIGRSATDLDQSVVGNIYITYVVPE